MRTHHPDDRRAPCSQVYHIDTDNAIETPRKWNGPPGVQYPLVRTVDGCRELARMRWGFVPSNNPDSSFAPVNARSETAAVKPTFRDAFANRRCVLPVNGWYEWQRRGQGRSIPHVVDDGAGGILHLAAIWEPWRGPRGVVDGFAVLTTSPAGAIAAIHHRQPSVLTIDDVDAWLDPATPLSEVRRLGALGAQRDYRVRRVGFEVNNVRNDYPELLAAAS